MAELNDYLISSILILKLQIEIGLHHRDFCHVQGGTIRGSHKQADTRSILWLLNSY